MHQRALVLRQAVQTRRDHPLNAVGDAQIGDRLIKGEVTPISPKDTRFLEAPAYLLDEQWNTGRMANDPALQVERRGGDPQDGIQHRPS